MKVTGHSDLHISGLEILPTGRLLSGVSYIMDLIQGIRILSVVRYPGYTLPTMQLMISGEATGIMTSGMQNTISREISITTTRLQPLIRRKLTLK